MRNAARPSFTLYRTYIRLHTYVYSTGDNSYAVHGMEQDSEIKRLRKQQATTPHRPVKTSRLLEAQRRERQTMTVCRPPQMVAQLGHFRRLNPRGKPKRVYTYIAGSS